MDYTELVPPTNPMGRAKCTEPSTDYSNKNSYNTTHSHRSHINYRKNKFGRSQESFRL
ncbi:protein of unknown function [Xenorhabdus poinarii G6]|uniref:Uncharacterized protein n=1 Tax=Xenorhabdus poinarii G6 TaxID=1354304 RepID=A0A068R6M0_9GAMM|nr:protein of unknown function [Xenorhabdus poinarii G6]